MSTIDPPTRDLLPPDVTQDELWWLYHNHPVLHQFCERLIAEAELNWSNHQKWERQLGP